MQVAPLEMLLSSLGNDNSLVEQSLTRLLGHSYFPPQVPVKEACKRCIVLIKRAPEAGAKFCKWLLSEGADPKSLLQLVQSLIRLVKDDELSPEVRSGTLLALSELCQSLLTLEEYQSVIGEMLNGDMLATLMGYAPDSLTRSYVLQIASKLPANNISRLVDYCCDLSMRSNLTPADIEEVSAVHTLVLAWGGCDELIKALRNALSKPNNLAQSKSKGWKDHTTSAEVPDGSNDVELLWTCILTSSTSKPSEGGKRSENAKLTAALGAAWQVEMLLQREETRLAVLSSGYSEELLKALRVLAQSSIDLARGESFQLASISHPASAVLAYMKLYFHMGLEGSDSDGENMNSSRSRREQQESPKSSPKASVSLDLVQSFCPPGLTFAQAGLC
jgi:condensin-2 complex subunit G2